MICRLPGLAGHVVGHLYDSCEVQLQSVGVIDFHHRRNLSLGDSVPQHAEEDSFSNRDQTLCTHYLAWTYSQDEYGCQSEPPNLEFVHEPDKVLQEGEANLVGGIVQRFVSVNLAGRQIADASFQSACLSSMKRNLTSVGPFYAIRLGRQLASLGQGSPVLTEASLRAFKEGAGWRAIAHHGSRTLGAEQRIRCPQSTFLWPFAAKWPSCKESSLERPYRKARLRKRGPFSGGAPAPLAVRRRYLGGPV